MSQHEVQQVQYVTKAGEHNSLSPQSRQSTISRREKERQRGQQKAQITTSLSARWKSRDLIRQRLVQQ